jgi:hypothetical protein
MIDDRIPSGICWIMKDEPSPRVDKDPVLMAA